MSNKSGKEKATWLYTCFLRLYPQEYRHAFGSQMLQTFKDHYTDVVETGKRARVRFWFDIVSDEVRGVLREQFTILKERIDMKNIWIKQGILFGMILGIIQIGYHLINNLAPANQTLNSLLNNSTLFAALLFTCLAGYLAARQTGRMETGAYAGLYAGLFSTVIGISALFVITFAFTDIISQNAFMIDDFHRSGLKSINQFIVEDAIGGAFFGTLFSLLAGGVFGTIGGYLGKTLKGQQN